MKLFVDVSIFYIIIISCNKFVIENSQKFGDGEKEGGRNWDRNLRRGGKRDKRLEIFKSWEWENDREKER